MSITSCGCLAGRWCAAGRRRGCIGHHVAERQHRRCRPLPTTVQVADFPPLRARQSRRTARGTPEQRQAIPERARARAHPPPPHARVAARERPPSMRRLIGKRWRWGVGGRRASGGAACAAGDARTAKKATRATTSARPAVSDPGLGGPCSRAPDARGGVASLSSHHSVPIELIAAPLPNRISKSPVAAIATPLTPIMLSAGSVSCQYQATIFLRHNKIMAYR